MTNPYSGADAPDLAEGLNADFLDGADLSTDGTFADNSDTKVPSQKAAKTYTDAQISGHDSTHDDRFYTESEIDALLGGYDVEEYGDITDTPTGFVEPDITVAWVNSTKTFTIGKGSNTYVWVRGIKHTLGATESIVGDGTNFTCAQGMWYFYYDIDGTGADCELQASQTFPGTDYGLVAFGYYDGDSHTVSAHDYLSSATATVEIHEIVKCVTGSLPTATANGEYYQRLTSNLGSTDLSLIDVTDGNWIEVTVADVVYPDFLGSDLFWEGHTTKLDPKSHYLRHTFDGMLFHSGFDVYNNFLAGGSPTSDKESRIAVEGGTLYDEDIQIDAVNDATPDSDFEQDLGGATDAAAETNPAMLPVLYLDGTKWKMTKPQPWAFHHGGTTTRPYYNSISLNNGLTEMTSSKFVPYYVCGTNHVKYPVILVMGQAEYGTLAEALIHPHALEWGATPFSSEIKVLWRYILQGKTSFNSATHEAVIRQVTDYRANDYKVVLQSSTTSHSDLGDLEYDSSGHSGFLRGVTLSTSEPSTDNDDSDTAALGNTFVKGDFWFETDDKELFVCADDATGAADWDKLAKDTQITALQTQVTALDEQKQKITAQNNGFWGDIIYKDADEITIKPKGQSGIAAWIGCILNDGTYLELSSEYTIKYDTPGNSGHIIDGITAKLNNEWFIPWGYEDSGGALAFGITWMPSTTFTDTNPTTTLTLAQINSQDIGYLFPVASHFVAWQDTNELETPFGYADAGAFTYDIANDIVTSIASRSATVLTLGGTLNNATFVSGSTVYQVDGFKPLQVSDGAVATVIGARGYKDLGFRFRTNGSAGVIEFSIYGNEVYFANGTGGADYDYSAGISSTTLSTVWVNYLQTYIPPDCGMIANCYLTGASIFTKKYFSVYGEVISSVASSEDNCVHKKELKVVHGILSAKNSAGTDIVRTRGYLI